MKSTPHQTKTKKATKKATKDKTTTTTKKATTTKDKTTNDKTTDHTKTTKDKTTQDKTNDKTTKDKTTKDKTTQQFKQHLKQMYTEAKRQRPRTLTTDFIHPGTFIQMRQKESKMFEKKVIELKSKRIIHKYKINTLFQIITKKM